MLFYLGMAAEATVREIFSFFCNHGFCFLHQPELQILKDYLKNCHLVKLLMCFYCFGHSAKALETSKKQKEALFSEF